MLALPVSKFFSRSIAIVFLLRRSHRAAALRASHPTISQFPKWCVRMGSNHQHPLYKSGALPLSYGRIVRGVLRIVVWSVSDLERQTFLGWQQAGLATQ